LLTIIVAFTHPIFVSDAHALAVLPNIARFALDKKFACVFVITIYKSRDVYQNMCSGK
jgi:hypothetical protein